MKVITNMILTGFFAFTLFFFSLGFNLASTNKAYACSCMPRTTDQRFEDSDLVFIATITNTSEEGVDIEGRIIATALVTKIYKGTMDLSSTQIFTPLNSAMCGVYFEEGKDYLVYANVQTNGQVTAHLCSGTTQIEYAADEIKYLDEINANSSFGENNSRDIYNVLSFTIIANILICLCLVICSLSVIFAIYLSIKRQKINS